MLHRAHSPQSLVSDPLTHVKPSGVTTTELTNFSCPLSTALQDPVFRSHTLNAVGRASVPDNSSIGRLACNR